MPPPPPLHACLQGTIPVSWTNLQNLAIMWVTGNTNMCGQVPHYDEDQTLVRMCVSGGAG